MSLGQSLAPHLPYLRRYARALTGSQASGDAYVRATLQSLIDNPDDFGGGDPRLELYRLFHAIWVSTRETEIADGRDGEPHVAAAVARARLSAITPLSRQALLLTALGAATLLHSYPALFVVVNTSISWPEARA